MNVLDKWMPGVLSDNFLSPDSVVESPKQQPKQRTVQFTETYISPVSVGSPMVASTPNMNDISQSIISEEVRLRIKGDKELRPWD